MFHVFSALRRMAIAVAGAAVLTGSIAVPAYAQTQTDMQTCSSVSAPASMVIPACTSVINAGSNKQREAALVNRGVAYLNSKDCASALKNFNAALELDARDDIALYDRGTCFARMGDYRTAIRDYDSSIRLQPDIKAYKARGLAYFNLGKYAFAERDYEKATSLNASDADAYLNLGLAREWAGRYADAIRAANDAIRLDVPDKETAYDIVAFSSRHLGDFTQAIDAANKMLQLNSRSSRAYYDLGYAYGARGDIDEAISDFDQAIAIKPKDSATLSERCIDRAMVNDLDGAIEDCNAAVAYAPKLLAYRYRRAIALYKRGRYANAIADLDAFIRTNPPGDYAYYLRGLAERKLGHNADAKRDLNVAARLHKNDLAPLGIRADGTTFAVASRPSDANVSTPAPSVADDPNRPSWARLNVSKKYGGDAVSQIAFPDGQVLTATRAVTIGDWNVAASKPAIQIYDQAEGNGKVELRVLNLNCTYGSTTQECVLSFQYDDSGTLTDYQGNRVSSFCGLTVGGLSDALKLYNAPCPQLLALAGSDKPTWADIKLGKAASLRSIHFIDGQIASKLSAAHLGSYTVKLTPESTIESASYGGLSITHISCTDASGKAGPYCTLHFDYMPDLEPGKRQFCNLTFEAMTSERIPCARDFSMKQ